jgi:hypothetical protein
VILDGVIIELLRDCVCLSFPNSDNHRRGGKYQK